MFNTTGLFNTAHGASALASNNTNAYNTATGYEALFFATADDNTATGALSLRNTTTGFWNTATGTSALYSNSTGYYNVASGVSALYYNLSGHDNTAEGYSALLNSTGSNNIALGSSAGANITTGSNNIAIGHAGQAGDAGKIRLGKSGTHTATLIAGIYNKTVTSGPAVGVLIDSNGKLGTVVSSARYKEAIQPMEKDSEAILALQPVSFRYKHELDPDGIQQFGLIAEQVEEISPDLVVRDEDGKVNAVRYEAVNAMLLNEFLKEHRRVQALESKAHEQEALIARQQQQIEALAATVQKVSVQLEVNRATQQVVASNQ